MNKDAPICSIYVYGTISPALCLSATYVMDTQNQMSSPFHFVFSETLVSLVMSTSSTADAFHDNSSLSNTYVLVL